MVQTGKSFTQKMTVQLKDTATVYGSGHLEVFATPAMVALMENTAVKCLEEELEKGSDTVGIEMNVQHLKATAVGGQVSCQATITQVEGRKISFKIEVWDAKGQVGSASHDRFIIDPERFMAKL